MPPERGLLGGRYELGDVIGYGGMAEVHRGRDVRLGRDVAIKLLRPDLSRDPAFEGRFRREAQAAASLNSPSIVAVFDAGEGDVDGTTTPYIVMEYVEGQTVRELLAAEGRLLPRRALEITAAVCAALEQAHAAGIVHRDIKPGNVMLTATGEVKVMDFGIARALTSSTMTMTHTAAVVGTAHYLSPEQARGEHVDARSDVYSTGCLLYELLTGAPPFTGETAVAVAYQHVREDPTPPSAVEPDVSSSIDAIVLVAMAKNPASRYASSAAMRADIERAIAGQPVLATPARRYEDAFVPTVSPTTVLVRERPKKRRGVAYALLALATIAVFVLALVGVRGLLSSTTTDLHAPALRGMTLSAAEAQLTSQGLVAGKITYRYTGKDNKGIVLDQDPGSGFFVHTGQVIDLTVSNGVRMVSVPTGLVGDTLIEARAALLTAGLRVGKIVQRPSDAQANQVLGSKPAQGTSVAANSKITLIVSNAQVKVPDVTLKEPSTASELLLEAGFNPVIRRSATFTPANAGLIVSQSPTAGTYAETGSTVTIYIDKKAPTPATTPPTTPSPNPSTSGSGSPVQSPSPDPTGSSSPPTH